MTGSISRRIAPCVAALALIACGEAEEIEAGYEDAPSAGDSQSAKADSPNDTSRTHIPDNNARGVSRTLVTGGPATRVWVEIRHPYRGDLRVVVTGPNGRQSVLHDRQGGSRHNLHLDWTVPAAMQAAGTWKLHVSDHAGRDVGYIESWGLDVADEPGGGGAAGEGELCGGIAGILCAAGLECQLAGDYPDAAGACIVPGGSGGDATTERPQAPIPDDNPRGLVRTLRAEDPVTRVWVEIDHTYRGDLHVSVKSPTGFSQVLHNRGGSSADDLSVSWDVPASAQSAGVWTLRVVDLARRDIGVLTAWGLDTDGSSPPPPPPPPPPAGCAEDCAAGSHCEQIEVYCFAAPCPQVFECVPDEIGGTVDDADTPIPDNDPRGVRRVLEANGPVVRVEVDILHTYRGDLRVTVIAPTGAELRLHDRGGRSADDLHIEKPIPAALRVAGRWTLWVQDFAGADTGIIDSWALEVDGGGTTPPPPPPPVARICDDETGLSNPVPTCSADAPCDRVLSLWPNPDPITTPTRRPDCQDTDLRTWDGADGTPRYACFHHPGNARGALPLLVWLHGAKGDADNVLTATDIRRHADSFDLTGDRQRRGFILVSVQGRNLRYPTETDKDESHFDNLYRDLAAPSTNADMALLDQIIDEIVAEGGVDTDRIYTMGHSNGGFFAQMYAIARHDTPTPGGHRVAATSVYSTGDPFADIDLHADLRDGSSCEMDPYPTSDVPLMLVGRDCDIMACDTRQANNLEAESGKDVQKWMSALSEMVDNENVERVILDGRGRTTNQCRRWCGTGLAFANHMNWPTDFEPAMLHFLREHPLR